MPLRSSGIHVLARAVIRVDDVVLVARRIGASNTFLPGGHVNEGERMHDAIARELREEFGRPSAVGQYLGAIEHVFAQGGVTQHEVNHFFRVTLPGVDAPQALASLEEHLEFFWQPVGQLRDVGLKPDPVVALISGGGGGSLVWASTLPAGA